MKKVIYLAHPLGDGADRPLNIERAKKWVAWAADQGASPIADWILIASVWSEAKREEGLAIDKTLIERCDEVWLCGPRISPGMNIESAHAKSKGIPVVVLVDPSWTEGPPLRSPTFDDLLARSPQGIGPVQRHFHAIAHAHGIAYEELMKLSALQILALQPSKRPTEPKPAAATVSEFDAATSDFLKGVAPPGSSLVKEMK